MIKMYINEEEVVCDKNIEIKEEMLATSSTILNNCYPKSWENNHDYISNFYFPKDYSKCLIYDEEPVQFTGIEGSTTQDGIPTPSNPVPIINKTGLININVGNKNYYLNLGNMEFCSIENYTDEIRKSTGKNLFDTRDVASSTTSNGITLTKDSSDKFTLNGTSTANFAYRPTLTNQITLKAGKTYTISTTNMYTSDVIAVGLRSGDTSVLNLPLGSQQSTSYTPQTDVTITNLNFYVANGYTINNFSFQIQLEENSTATDLEPYGTGIWYKYAKIGKVVLDGSENYGYTAGSSTSLGYYYLNANAAYFNGVPSSENTLCNYYSLNMNRNQNGTFRLGNSAYFQFVNTNISSVADFKTWLSTHNTIIYYPLATPTIEVIEDTTLINQLNNIGNYLLFCGVVKNTGDITLNPREPHYCNLQILDFKTFLSEGETLDFVISNKSVSEAINMVVNEISQYGFIVGNINIAAASDIIGAYSTLEKTAYDVFQYLADITQSKWYTRMIDQNTIAIDFYDIDNLPHKNDIEYNVEYFEENNIQDITFNYSTQDYRNKQIMLSDEVYGSIDYNDNILADGYNTTFNLLNNIGVLKNISVNGISKTFATSEEKEIGIEADFYYTIGNNSIESNETYSAGSQIDISYTPLVKGRQIVYNDDEVTRVANQINRKGVIARYERRNDVLSSDELYNIAQTYITYKGQAEIILKLNTYNSDLYNIGDIVYFNAPLDDLKQSYMVKKKTTQIIATTNDIFYEYELSSTYNSENAINYFDNQRAKAKGNITAGEYITRNIDIENSATIIFNNLTITEVDEGNILNSTLNAPLNN